MQTLLIASSVTQTVFKSGGERVPGSEGCMHFCWVSVKARLVAAMISRPVGNNDLATPTIFNSALWCLYIYIYIIESGKRGALKRF